MDTENNEGASDFTEIYVWGSKLPSITPIDDYYGQLGVGMDRSVHRVPKVCSFNIVIKQVSCGEEHTAFVAQHSGHVYSMGSNTDGKLGVGKRNLKQSNVPCLVEGLNNIVKVACGMSHTLAINSYGEVYVWGQGFYGALGLNDTKTYDKPIKNSDFNNEQIVDIAAGSRHSLFLTANGKVLGCGEAKSGQLGLGQSAPEKVIKPTYVTALNDQRITKVCCGKFHSFFLTQSKHLLATGTNSFGQLGTGNKQNSYVPMKLLDISDVKDVSAWHFSAAVTENNKLYVWGTGIFGEFTSPSLIQSDVQFTTVQVGGSFAVLLDKKNKAYVWGANTNGELGVGDTQPKTHPAILPTIEDKQVLSVGVGSAFAFALGNRMVSNENYQTFLTDEALPTMSIDSPKKQFEQAQRSKTPASFSSPQLDQGRPEQRGFNHRHTDNLDYKPSSKLQSPLQDKKSDLSLHEMQRKLSDNERQIQKLKEENRLLQDELHQSKQNESKAKLDLETLRKAELGYKQKLNELELKVREISQSQTENLKFKEENERMRREIDELNGRLMTYQKLNHHKREKSHSNNTTSIDFNSPGMVTIDAKLNRFEDDFGSPTTIAHDLTTLKIEDLQEAKKENYNPVWRLQVTDDANHVKYDNRFVDRNIDNEREPFKYQPPRQDYDNRYRYDPPRRDEYIPPQYDRITDPKSPKNLQENREYNKPLERQQTFDYIPERKREEFTFANRNIQYQEPHQLLSDDRKVKQDRLYNYDNRLDYENARHKNIFIDQNKDKHYEPISKFAKENEVPNRDYDKQRFEDRNAHNYKPTYENKDYEPINRFDYLKPKDQQPKKEIEQNRLLPQYQPTKVLEAEEDRSKFKINLVPMAGKPNAEVPSTSGVSRIDEIRQKLDKFKQQREESGKAIGNYNRDQEFDVKRRY